MMIAKKYQNYIFITLLGLLLIFSPFLIDLKTQAAGTITGTVFRDYNGNGTRQTSATTLYTDYNEPAVEGVTVNGYDSTGALVGTTTSAANGNYSLSHTGSGQIRVEFLIPSATQPLTLGNTYSGSNGNTYGSAVQFVTENQASVNFAVNNPKDYYTSADPTLSVIRISPHENNYVNTQNNPSLLTFPYSSIGTAPTLTTLSTHLDTGATFGLAYKKDTNDYFMSAVLKRAALFGTGGPGAIYRRNNAGTTSLYVDLDGVFGAGTTGVSPHNGGDKAATTYDDGVTAALISTMSLGDLDISEDLSKLYTVNTFDKRLYIIPTAGALNSSTITRHNIPQPASCTAANTNPFALGVHENQVYVGITCRVPFNTQPRLYVYRFDPNSNTFDNTPVLDFLMANGSLHANFLSNIAFKDNDMILMCRERNGDANYVVTNAYFADTIRAFWNGSGWTVENNGSFGAIVGAGAGNGQGIGGGEYYLDHATAFPTHVDAVLGSGVNVPGRAMVTTLSDVTALQETGIQWYNENGDKGKVARIYQNTNGTIRPLFNFGKGLGLGDMELLTENAPIEVGNRVWYDANNNGVQDPGENPIANVDLELWADTDSDGIVDTRVGLVRTDANGSYYFVSSTSADSDTTDNVGQVNGGILPNTAYQVRIPSSEFGVGQPLNGLFTTRANADGSPNGDSRDSDGSLLSGNVIANFVTGGAGVNNHTFDFGFYLAPTAASVSVGGRIQSADGRGIRNVVVTLTDADGQSVSTRTGAFGYYRFEGVEVGQTITVGVQAKQFNFNQPTRVISLEDAIEDLDFTADGFNNRTKLQTDSKLGRR